jgi:hypothetical protein
LEYFPGPITNEALLKNPNKYYRDNDASDPTNFQIKSKLRERYDFRLITREIWNLLQSKYGGLELKREKDSDTYARRFIIRF